MTHLNGEPTVFPPIQGALLSRADALSADAEFKTYDYSGWDETRYKNGEPVKAPPIPSGLIVVTRYSGYERGVSRLRRAAYDLIHIGERLRVVADAASDFYETPYFEDFLVEVDDYLAGPEAVVCVEAIAAFRPSTK